MAVPPDGWVNAYLNVFVPTLRLVNGRVEAGPMAFVPITKYANANHAHQQAERSAANSQFQSWLRSPGHHLGHLTNGHVVSLPAAAPPISTTDTKVYLAFHGKGSPDELRDVLRLVSLWMSTQPTITGDIAQNLRAFADAYLGVDCNGFVGTYLRDNFPQSRFGPEFQIQGVPHHCIERTAVDQVSELDLVIPRDWSHVSIIGTIFSRTPTQIDCMLCESRSEILGGVHSTRLRITRTPGPHGTLQVGHGQPHVYSLRTMQGATV